MNPSDTCSVLTIVVTFFIIIITPYFVGTYVATDILIHFVAKQPELLNCVPWVQGFITRKH